MFSVHPKRAYKAQRGCTHISLGVVGVVSPRSKVVYGTAGGNKAEEFCVRPAHYCQTTAVVVFSRSLLLCGQCMSLLSSCEKKYACSRWAHNCLANRSRHLTDDGGDDLFLDPPPPRFKNIDTLLRRRPAKLCTIIFTTTPLVRAMPT